LLSINFGGLFPEGSQKIIPAEIAHFIKSSGFLLIKLQNIADGL